MSKKTIVLFRRQLFALIFGFIVFQILFFPLSQKTFGIISIPWLGSVGFFLGVITIHIVDFLAFPVPAFKAKFVRIAIFVSIFTAFCALFRASFQSQFLLSGLSVFWWAVSFYLLVSNSCNLGAFSEIVLFPFSLLKTTPFSLQQIWSLISTQSQRGNRLTKNASRIILYIAVIVPVVGFLLLLLLSADPIFGNLVQNLFKFDFSFIDFMAQFAWRIFFSVGIIFALFLITLTKITNNFTSPLSQINNQGSQLLGPYLALAITCCIVLGVFIAVQLKYLFAINGLADLASFGILTFSEYVKKGFFELILATGFVYIISGVGLVLYRSFKPHKIHLVANFSLIALNLALVAMTYRRVSLYTLEHGLTHIRIYGSMLLLITTVFLLTLLARYMIKHHKLHLLELFAATLIVFSYGMINIDYILARVAPPTVNNQVDFNYLSSLSADDTESWINVYNQIQKDVPQILSKNEYGLDERIYLTRSKWAINKIYGKMGSLAVKYRDPVASKIYTDEFRFEKKYRLLDSNIAEYQGYLNIKNNVSFNELRELRDALLRNQPQFSGDIPRDVYQFYY